MRDEDNEHDNRDREWGVASPPTGLGVNGRRRDHLSVRKSVCAHGPCESPSYRPVGENCQYGVQAVGRHAVLPFLFAGDETVHLCKP